MNTAQYSQLLSTVRNQWIYDILNKLGYVGSCEFVSLEEVRQYYFGNVQSIVRFFYNFQSILRFFCTVQSVLCFFYNVQSIFRFICYVQYKLLPPYLAKNNNTIYIVTKKLRRWEEDDWEVTGYSDLVTIYDNVSIAVFHQGATAGIVHDWTCWICTTIVKIIYNV